MPSTIYRNVRELEVLFDRNEIQDVLLRYCRGIDRCDETLVRSAYHEDAIDSRGDRVTTGWEFAKTVIAGMRKQSVRTTHCLTNILINLYDDMACAESYLFSYIWTGSPGDEKLTVLAGRYLDRFEKRNRTWAISHRVLVHDWTVHEVEAKAWTDPAITGMILGVRGRADALYQMLPD